MEKTRYAVKSIEVECIRDVTLLCDVKLVQCVCGLEKMGIRCMSRSRD